MRVRVQGCDTVDPTLWEKARLTRAKALVLYECGRNACGAKRMPARAKGVEVSWTLSQGGLCVQACVLYGEGRRANFEGLTRFKAQGGLVYV